MSKKLYEETNIQGIAAAIREKNGTQNTYTTAQMASAIRTIHTDPVLEDLTATENKVYLPSDGKDGFGRVEVAVPSSAAPVIQSLYVNHNGVYQPPSGVDGFGPVTVNVSGGEDDPFALKNYIESSGTQYINTGYLVKDDTDFEAVASLSNTGSYPTIFGVRAISKTDASGLGCFICSRWQSYGYAGVNWGSSMVAQSALALANYYGKKCIIKLNKGKKYLFESEDGYAIANYFSSEVSATQDYPLYIFTLNTGGNIEAVNWCTMKLYRFRIFESGVLVHEFIPWQDNGVACLKDTVTGNIKYNAGTGDFVYGTDL